MHSSLSRRADLAVLQALTTSGMDVVEQMPLLSECLHRLVPSFSLSLMRVDDDCVPHAHYSEHFDEWSHRAFAEHAHMLASDPTDPASFGRLLRQKRPYGTLIDTRPEYVAGGIYQNMFKRNGIHHCLDVAVRSRVRPLGILGIFREQGQRPFDAGDVEAVRTIYDHLVHAFEAPPAAASPDSPDYDETSSALLVATPAGRIEWASPAAIAWLEDATFGPDRTRLLARRELPDAVAELARRLARLRGQRRSGTDLDVPTTTLVVPGGRLRLRAYALDGERGVEATPSRIGIQLALEIRKELRVIGAIDRAPITPQQKRLAHALVRRTPTDAIARELGVTAGTLKMYRKDLYLRLGVESASELTSTIQRTAASLRFDLDRHRPRRA